MPVRLIQIPSRLICKKNRWFVDEGSCDAHPLLFASRKVRWRVVEPVLQADVFEGSYCLRFIRAPMAGTAPA